MFISKKELQELRDDIKLLEDTVKWLRNQMIFATFDTDEVDTECHSSVVFNYFPRYIQKSFTLKDIMEKFLKGQGLEVKYIKTSPDDIKLVKGKGKKDG